MSLLDEIDKLISAAENAIDSDILDRIYLKDIDSLGQLAEMQAGIGALKQMRKEAESDSLRSERSESYFAGYIEDEIADAEKYYNAWIKTKIELFRTLAREEAGHGQRLISLAIERGENMHSLKASLSAIKQKIG